MLPPDSRLAAAPCLAVVSGVARLVLITVIGLAMVPLATGPTASAQSTTADLPSAAHATTPSAAPNTASDSALMQPPYEALCPERTGIQSTMIIPAEADLSVKGRPLVPGDQVAVFSDEGVCAGFVTWTGENVSLTIWGDDYLTSEVDGLLGGDPMHIRIRTAATGMEHSARNSHVTVTFRDDADHFSSTSTFTPNGIYVVKTLAIDSVEHANGAK